MTLHWLRKHQKTVLAPLTVVVIVTFVFVFGGGGRLRGGRGGTVAVVEGRRITRGEFLAVEKALVKLTGEEIRTDDPVLVHFIKAMVAEKAGVGPSTVELRQVKRNILARWVGKIEYTPAELQRELRRRRITEQELLRVVEEDLAWRKLDGLLGSSAKLTTDELYLAQAREKQRLTVLYKDFRVSRYEEGVEVSEKAIEDHYESKKSDPPSAAPELYTKPEADIAALFASEEAFGADIKVKEEELREAYERRKEFFYRKEEGDGYKPFDEVKAEIEEELKRGRASGFARKALKKGLDAFNEAYDADASPRVEKYAKEGLQVIRRLAVLPSGLEDLGPAGDSSALFQFIFDERSRAESGGALSLPVSVEKGWAAVRVVSFRPPKLKSLEEAKEEIAARLEKAQARMNAKKDALKLVDRWRKGEVDEAKEVVRRGPVGPADEIASGFAYLPAGEVSQPLAVGEGEEGMLYRAARLVLRGLPSKEKFKPDEALRTKNLGMRYAFLSRWFRSYLVTVDFAERKPIHRRRSETD